MKLIECPLTENSCFRLDREMKVRGIMLHSIGCAQPRAEVFAARWNDPDKEVAVHGFIDGITGDVWQFLPWRICGWHAGGIANLSHIGVEMGEPDVLKYKPGTATFTVSDADRAEAIRSAELTYSSAVELFAYLCEGLGLDPLADGTVIGHAEGHARGIASNHADPEHLWRGLGLAHTMDGFRRDVAARMGAVKDKKDKTEKDETTEPIEKAADPSPEIYTVVAGDTLSAICARFGADMSELIKQNAIADPNLIYVGQVLTLPRAAHAETEYSEYTVKAGDSLWGIAKERLGSGTRYTEIAELNGIEGCRILPGDKLKLPRRESR